MRHWRGADPVPRGEDIVPATTQKELDNKKKPELQKLRFNDGRHPHSVTQLGETPIPSTEKFPLRAAAWTGIL